MFPALFLHTSRPDDRAREAHPVPDAPRRAGFADRWVIHPFVLAVFPILGLFASNSLQVPWGDLRAPIALGLAATLAVWLVATVLLRDARKAGVFTTLGLVPFWLGGRFPQELDTALSDLSFYWVPMDVHVPPRVSILL